MSVPVPQALPATQATQAALRCSVVIPSRNRRASLARVLDALERQTVPPAAFEVIVVLDGPTDDSPRFLEERRRAGGLPHLRWAVQPRQGQAAARNTGARLAQAPVLLFVDDDILPEPGLVAAHLAHHHDGGPVVVHGDSLFVREPRDAYYPLGAWAWWEDLFHQRARPGHLPAMRDFCAGNVSLRREEFLRAGGFDASFTGYGGEDYELGRRLLQAGARFVADRRARAWHHHRADVAAVLRNTRQEAHGDLLLAARHPEVRAGLRLAQPLRGQTLLLVRVAMQAPLAGDLLVALARSALPLLQRLRLRRRWFRWFKLARNWAYWRGVRDALGSWAALAAWRAAIPAASRHTLDVSAGLPVELPPLSPDVPGELEVTAHGRAIGVLLVPGPFERPLREILLEELPRQLGPELAEAALREAAARGAAAPWYLDPAALRSTGAARGT